MLHRHLIMLALTIMPPLCSAADTIAWGSPQNGMRIGITPNFKVILENTGAVGQTVLIGRTTGVGPIYSLNLLATAPDGREFKLFMGGVGGVAGFMGPLPLRLAPGATQEVTIPVDKIFMLDGPGRDRKLSEILRQKYSVSVSLTVEQSEVDWATRSDTTFRGQIFWTGAITSGKFRDPA